MGRSTIRAYRTFTLQTSQLLSPREVRLFGEGLIAQIQRRTVSGKNETRLTFEPYSVSYADREKGGRRAPVTLVQSGAMQADMYVETATSRLLRLGFRSDAMALRASYHDNPRGFKRPIRRFLGVAPSWLTAGLRAIRLSWPRAMSKRAI